MAEAGAHLSGGSDRGRSMSTGDHSEHTASQPCSELPEGAVQYCDVLKDIFEVTLMNIKSTVRDANYRLEKANDEANCYRYNSDVNPDKFFRAFDETMRKLQCLKENVLAHMEQHRARAQEENEHRWAYMNRNTCSGNVLTRGPKPPAQTQEKESKPADKDSGIAEMELHALSLGTGNSLTAMCEGLLGQLSVPQQEEQQHEVNPWSQQRKQQERQQQQQQQQQPQLEQQQRQQQQQQQPQQQQRQQHLCEALFTQLHREEQQREQQQQEIDLHEEQQPEQQQQRQQHLCEALFLQLQFEDQQQQQQVEQQQQQQHRNPKIMAPE